METEKTDPGGQSRRTSSGKTAASLLGFGLLLALVLLLARGAPVEAEDGGRVVFTEADLAHVSAAFERTWSRPPTPAELRQAFDRYVRDEVLYREALARELDRNDPVVKLSLVRKITLLGTAAAEAARPTDAELEAYFDLRAERYRVPGSLDLVQVCLSPDERGESVAADAEELLSRLREDEPPPEELAALSDLALLPGFVEDASEEQLGRTFGPSFRDSVASLETGRWEGPVESGYGLHLVKIIRREESRIPEWTEVRERLETDLRFDARKAAEDQFYAEVLPRYQVFLSDGVRAVLEGDSP
jgi:hypothetical protein